MNISDTLSVIGAVTGVLALYISWRAFRLDRPRVRVRTHLGARWKVDHSGHTVRFEIVATNIGRRVVRLVRAGIILPPEASTWWPRFSNVTHPDPDMFHVFDATSDGDLITLEEGDRHVFACEPLEPAYDKKIGKRGVVFVEDTAHRLYTRRYSWGNLLHDLRTDKKVDKLMEQIAKGQRKEGPNQASHATSEPAPGAASSARED